MSDKKIVFLTGFMGVGKSATGIELSKILNYSFLDTDTLIEEMYNTTIPKIFEEEGETNGYENVIDFMQETIDKSDGMLTAFESISPIYPQDKYIQEGVIGNFNEKIRNALNLYEVGGTFDLMKTTIS